jgi:hypothetical protein
MAAMRVEYRRKGSEKWEIAAFLTHLPEIVSINPAVKDEPESGGIRCVLFNKNREVGQYSPVMNVTISAD